MMIVKKTTYIYIITFLFLIIKLNYNYYSTELLLNDHHLYTIENSIKDIFNHVF